MKILIKSLALAICAAPVLAADQPYAGQETREIASLSQEDVTALLDGQGWGLAKPAELNGYPGPAHILELAKDLGLTDAQVAQVQAIFDDMQAQARTLGQQYVDNEAHLSRMFSAGHANPEMLEQLLAQSGQTLAALRQVHLTAHIAATPILSDEQRTKYAALRGYGSGEHGTGHSGHSGH